MEHKHWCKEHILWCLFLIGAFIINIGTVIAPDDFLMHVTFGKWILENKQFPELGVFSWYAEENGVTYQFHEWLAGVINVFYEKFFGLELGEWIYICIHLIIIAGVLYFTVKDEWVKKSKFAVIWTCALGGAVCSIATARPVMYGIMFFILEMWALEKLKYNKESKAIWIVPIMAIPWSNLHGGSAALSYLFIGLYIFFWGVSQYAKENQYIFVLKQDKVVLKKLCIALVLTFLGCCFNPSGVGMLTYTLSHYVGFSDHQWIYEWQAASITKMPLTFLLIFFMVVFWFYVSKNKKIEITDLILFIAFGLMALKTYRYLPWFCCAMHYVVWRYVDNDNKKDTLRPIVFGICGIALIIYSFAEVGIKGADKKIWLEQEVFDTLRELNPQRIYNGNQLGNILLYEGFEVFTDGRGDMYSSIVVNNEMSFLDEAMYWERASYKVDLREFIDKYNFDAYVVIKEANINYFLQAQQDIECIYHDELIYIYRTVE